MRTHGHREEGTTHWDLLVRWHVQWGRGRCGVNEGRALGVKSRSEGRKFSEKWKVDVRN